MLASCDSFQFDSTRRDSVCTPDLTVCCYFFEELLREEACLGLLIN
jgi:hypothetical protein